ncbi:MAG: hypothetical protein WBD28_08470 [Candidatus Zixiibacteriota bacterium]
MRFGLVILLVFTMSSLVLAGNIAQQKVNYRIESINEISINEGINSLVMSFDDSKTEGRAKWAITTNENNKRVVGSLDEDLPPGLKLYVELQAPEGSLSKNPVNMSTNPQDLVTHISRVAQGDLNITYKLVTEPNISKIELRRVLTIVLMDGF